MQVNKSQVAELLMTVRSRSSVYSKQDFKTVFTKLYYLIIDLDDLSPPNYKRYESRSQAGNQLRQICELLSGEGNQILTAKLEQRLLTSVLEVTMGSLMELTNKKIECILDIFFQYYYKGGVNDPTDGVLESSFLLEKLTKAYDLQTLFRSV